MRLTQDPSTNHLCYLAQAVADGSGDGAAGRLGALFRAVVVQAAVLPRVAAPAAAEPRWRGGSEPPPRPPKEELFK